MRIREMRKRAGMTQMELAKVLGVDRSSIAKWERGYNAPRTSMLPKVAAAMNCSVDELYNSAQDACGRSE